MPDYADIAAAASLDAGCFLITFFSLFAISMLCHTLILLSPLFSSDTPPLPLHYARCFAAVIADFRLPFSAASSATYYDYHYLWLPLSAIHIISLLFSDCHIDTVS